MDERERLLHMAVSVAAKAAAFISSMSGGPVAGADVSRRDIKVDIDRDSEHLILGELQASGIPAIGEEGVADGPASPGARYWVIDPLDGTANFARGIPLYCISIALMDEGVPVLGVVHDVVRGECFAGAVGLGLTVNGVPASVSAVGRPEEAILVTGLPSRSDFSTVTLEVMGRDFARWFKVRMLGSAALSLAYVAAGRVDAYRESAIMPWDVMAGVALVRAGGGDACITGTGVRDPLDVRAANPSLLHKMVSCP